MSFSAASVGVMPQGYPGRTRGYEVRSRILQLGSRMVPMENVSLACTPEGLQGLLAPTAAPGYSPATEGKER